MTYKLMTEFSGLLLSAIPTGMDFCHLNVPRHISKLRTVTFFI